MDADAPLFSWSVLVANVMLFLSIPAFGVGLIQVYLDRVIGTAFYDIAAGGDPLLWSHLFWYCLLYTSPSPRDA